MASRYQNDSEIAKAQRDFELKKAAYDQEVLTKKAQSDLAYELQASKIQHSIIGLSELMKEATMCIIKLD